MHIHFLSILDPSLGFLKLCFPQWKCEVPSVGLCLCLQCGQGLWILIVHRPAGRGWRKQMPALRPHTQGLRDQYFCYLNMCEMSVTCAPGWEPLRGGRSISFGIRRWLWHWLLCYLGKPPHCPKHRFPHLYSGYNHLQEELRGGWRSNEMNSPGSKLGS